MNKKTCEAIDSVIKIIGKDKIWFKNLRYEIDYAKAQGCWFYSMKFVVTSKKSKHILKSLYDLTYRIGAMNGEYLSRNLERHTLKIY